MNSASNGKNVVKFGIESPVLTNFMDDFFFHTVNAYCSPVEHREGEGVKWHFLEVPLFVRLVTFNSK